MTATTRGNECSVAAVTLNLAFELGSTKWTLGFTTAPAQRPRLRTIPARDLEAVRRELLAGKARFGLPPGAPVRSCYEAGRDGFWLHRWLWRRASTIWWWTPRASRSIGGAIGRRRIGWMPGATPAADALGRRGAESLECGGGPVGRGGGRAAGDAGDRRGRGGSPAGAEPEFTGCWPRKGSCSRSTGSSPRAGSRPHGRWPRGAGGVAGAP